MRKVLCLIFAVVLLLTFGGCQMETPKFSKHPYQKVEEGDRLTNEKVQAIIKKVPTDRYEEYPELHNVPLRATLYRDGQEICLDVSDPRVIGLMNFYNNSVYYKQYSYTQGLLPIEDVEKYTTAEEFRLVLIFEPSTEIEGDGYDTNILKCDMFVVTNKWFVIIAHDFPGYEGQEDRYPYAAYGHSPLYWDYPWLDLFGF